LLEDAAAKIFNPNDFHGFIIKSSGPGSLVGIATGNGLDGPGIESVPVQTGPGSHLASCAIGTGSFLGGKERAGPDADPSPTSSAVVKKE